PRWQRKRLEVFQRDGFKCVVCGNDKKTLHVHHKKYNGDPWDVSSDFLVTICEICHAKEHRLPGFIDRHEHANSFHKQLSKLSNDELEAFVKKRLGQTYPEPKIQVWSGGWRRPEHLRFEFN